MLVRLRRSFDGPRTAPFEFAVAVVSVWTGAISFFGITLGAQTLNQTLPIAAVATFNLIYFVSGLFIIIGLGRAYRNIEASGLILLATALVVRSIAVIIGAGITPIALTAVFQAVVFVIACMARLFAVLKYKLLIPDPEFAGPPK